MLSIQVFFIKHRKAEHTKLTRSGKFKHSILLISGKMWFLPVSCFKFKKQISSPVLKP